MPTPIDYANYVRTKKYGSEVRDAIANAIEYMSNQITSFTGGWFGYRGPLNDNTNLDTLTGSENRGMWRMYGGDSRGYTGVPTDEAYTSAITSPKLLFVYYAGDKVCRQELYIINSGAKWSKSYYARSRNADASADWSAWQLSEGTTDATLSLAGQAADARVAGSKIAALENSEPGRIYVPCEDGLYNYSSGVSTVEKISSCLIFNGRNPNTPQRYCIYGSFAYSGTQPSYANRPAWYHEPYAKFVIGHEYYMSYKLISGSIDRSTASEPEKDFYFDLRTSSGSSTTVSSGSATPNRWTCTFVPEMIAFCSRNFTFSNAVVEILIYDLDEVATSPVYSKLTYALDPEVSMYDIPDYFVENVNTAIEKVIDDINSNKGDATTNIESFVFITDVHWSNNSKHSPGLIKKILDETPVSTVIFGGDAIENHNPTKQGAVAEIKEFTNAIVDIPCYEYYAVFGNHDDNSNGTGSMSDEDKNRITLTKQEQYNLLYAPFANQKNVHWAWEESSDVFSIVQAKNDYYFDHPKTKTRYLCLDWNAPFTAASGESAARGNWISSVLSRNDGYRVVIVCHGIYDAGQETPSASRQALMTLIADYKTKIVCMISGHTHSDNVIDYYGDGEVPIIITSCDKLSENAGAVANTVTEQCFDVVVIDYGNNVIKLTRVGRGTDREVTIRLS